MLMNYKLIYEQLVKHGQGRIMPIEQYCERHHIIPKCMGGGNEEKNMVSLTAREHFIAHKLLVKIYPEVGGLWAALRFMNDMNTDFKLTSKQYQVLRERYSEYRTIPRKTTACEICSKEFEQIEHLNHRFCSLKCWGISKQGPREVRKCKLCSSEFKVLCSRVQEFCSLKCTYEHKKLKNRVELTCSQCNDVFTVRPSYAKTRVYCSRKCNYASRS
jgi:hypothetical protein